MKLLRPQCQTAAHNEAFFDLGTRLKHTRKVLPFIAILVFSSGILGFVTVGVRILADEECKVL
jgi:hypothetical protein